MHCIVTVSGLCVQTYNMEEGTLSDTLTHISLSVIMTLIRVTYFQLCLTNNHNR
jgi:hypothetical protein